jgi:opacity protein-like surface antigen
MFKRLLLSCLLTSIIFAANSAVAEVGFAGGGLGFLDAEVTDDESANLTALTFRLGADLNEYFSGELRMGFGLAENTVHIGDDEFDVRLKNLRGVYIRAGYPTSETFYPYIIVGHTTLKIEESLGSLTESDTDSDVSFGAGVDLHMSERSTLNIEFIRYYDKDGAEIRGINAGVAFNF